MENVASKFNAKLLRIKLLSVLFNSSRHASSISSYFRSRIHFNAHSKPVLDEIKKNIYIIISYACYNITMYAILNKINISIQFIVKTNSNNQLTLCPILIMPVKIHQQTDRRKMTSYNYQ